MEIFTIETLDPGVRDWLARKGFWTDDEIRQLMDLDATKCLSEIVMMLLVAVATQHGKRHRVNVENEHGRPTWRRSANFSNGGRKFSKEILTSMLTLSDEKTHSGARNDIFREALRNDAESVRVKDPEGGPKGYTNVPEHGDDRSDDGDREDEALKELLAHRKILISAPQNVEDELVWDGDLDISLKETQISIDENDEHFVDVSGESLPLIVHHKKNKPRGTSLMRLS
ncbi:hypothetical protein UCRPC4_g00851 [Phaeomoniella chlamydospora]|uniref:Uncharacterized protein n=1 Tax=Phaeomoniella chlamydospora TaxID=158046 RepID=A0A0G2GWM1_PHACM|nr:hypothetical protein UCRPC4_g00851 [Phaeomoniella chlamydospora]